VIVVSPEANKTAREDSALAEKLAAYKASLSAEEIAGLARQTAELKAYQEEPSSQEDLEKIPMLKREDIERESGTFSYEKKEVDGTTVIHSNFFTSGIGYLKLLFRADRVKKEDLPYVGLLKSVLGYVDTEHYSYSDLTSEIYLNSGGIDFSMGVFPDLRKPGAFTGVFAASAKVLYEKLDFGFSMIREILTCSRLEDEKRLGEILEETKSRARMRMESGSHSAAVGRATAYVSASASFSDLTGGVGYYQFLENTAKRYAEEPEYRRELIEKLKETTARLFTKDNLLVGYTADDEGYQNFPALLQDFKEALFEGDGKTFPYEFQADKKNEGFTTASQVNYVARCGLFDPKAYTGALKVLKVIMNYDYLWMNLRVKGGSYGCMSGFGRTGEGYFVSYRDPNLGKTNEIYDGVVEYLKNFSIDDRDMTKYVIGAISDTDAPLTPAVRGSRNLSAYLSGVTDEMVQKERNEILDVTQEDIRALADIVKPVLDTGALCVIGNEEQIKADSEMFGEIKGLYH
jgi:hypothetical protein